MRQSFQRLLLTLPAVAAVACASNEGPDTTGDTASGSGGAPASSSSSSSSSGTGGAASSSSSSGTAGGAPSLFASPASYVVGQSQSNPFWLTSGDIDGDGKVDLIVTNMMPTASDVSVLLGKADGTFQPQIDVPADFNSMILSAVTGDFDGDGKGDLAVSGISLMAGGGGVWMLKGTGAGNVEPWPMSTFYPGPGQPMHLVARDVNGDGKLDLVVPSQSGNGVRVYLGEAGGKFGEKGIYLAGPSPIGVAVADLNGDGKLDLAVANFADPSVLLGNGDGSFQAETSYPGGGETRDVAIGDFDGDGKLDLALANGVDDSVSVLLGKGDGTFGAATTVPCGKTPIAIALADFDGDGKLDVAVANFQGNTVGVLLGKGDGTFAPVVQITVGLSPTGLVTADFNGDGKPDLATTDTQDRDVSVLLNTWP